MSLLKRLEKGKATEESSIPDTRGGGARYIPIVNPWREFKGIVHHEIIETLETTHTSSEVKANSAYQCGVAETTLFTFFYSR